MVRFLIAIGAQIEEKDEDGENALFHAVDGGYIDIVKELISSEANVNVSNNIRVSALEIAAENNNAEMVQLLIEHVLNLKIW